jgi:hypothetical protein
MPTQLLPVLPVLTVALVPAVAAPKNSLTTAPQQAMAQLTRASTQAPTLVHAAADLPPAAWLAMAAAAAGPTATAEIASVRAPPRGRLVQRRRRRRRLK